MKLKDYWERVRDDDRLALARKTLSLDQLRILFQHARDSLQDPPRPDGETVWLSVDFVPHSSIVGGGLILKKMNGQAGFIVNFIGTSDGITKAETAALSEQFAWFVSTYGCAVPARNAGANSEG
jgi:hypothetical protein